jgi:hypothetical protein
VRRYRAAGKRKKSRPCSVAVCGREELRGLQEALALWRRSVAAGRSILSSPSQAQGIYARILSDISQRYIVGYYPTNKERDGKRRKIDFEVKGHPEYTILGRRSYYAPQTLTNSKVIVLSVFWYFYDAIISTHDVSLDVCLFNQRSNTSSRVY